MHTFPGFDILGSTNILFSLVVPSSEDISEEEEESLTLSDDLAFSWLPDIICVAVLDPELDDEVLEPEEDELELDELDVVDVDDFDVELLLLELELLRSVEDLLAVMSVGLSFLFFCVMGDM